MKTRESNMTHYAVRLDKVGYIDPEHSYGVERRTFRSLNALMGWIQKEHGANVYEWGVQEYNLAHTRIPPQPSTFSWILGIDYPSVNIDCWLDENHEDCDKCERYTFEIYFREGEPAKGFSYSEEEEQAFANAFENDECRSTKRRRLAKANSKQSRRSQ